VEQTLFLMRLEGQLADMVMVAAALMLLLQLTALVALALLVLLLWSGKNEKRFDFP
jgi:hypothetical protein